MKTISAADIHDISVGSVFLATGGGGDPWVSRMLAEQVLTDRGPVQLIGPEALPDGARVVALGGVGAPTASLELLPSLEDPAIAVRAFERELNVTVDALVSFEVGGGNSLVPIQAAALLDLPVIDGDGMGRALPEAQMMTFALAGIPPTPALALDYRGETELFQSLDGEQYEPIIRAWAHSHGGMITTVEHLMTREDVASAIVPKTISFAAALGQVIRRHEGHLKPLLREVSQLFDESLYGSVHPLCTGKIVGLEQSIQGGYDIGRVHLESFDTNTSFELLIKNEFIQLSQGDTVLATVPDLIIALDFESGQPINAERLAYGQRLCVLGIGAPPHYRTADALEVVGPSNFGLNEPYRPLS